MGHLLMAQECFSDKRKDKKLVQKIERLIEKRAFYDAFDELNGKEEFAVFYDLWVPMGSQKGSIVNKKYVVRGLDFY